MRVIVAGSRSIKDYELVKKAIEDSGFKISILVCGEARGVDSLGRRWAESHEVPIKSFAANWDIHGRGAGHIRNKEMAEYAQALVLVWDGQSAGSKSMKKYAGDKGISIYEVVVKDESTNYF